MKIAAIYARVSTSNQEKEATVDSQIDVVKKRILSDNNVIGEGMIFIDNGWSGKNMDRPELDRMLYNAKINKFDTLYIYDLGRLSRDHFHQGFLLQEIGKSGCEVISIHDGKCIVNEEEEPEQFISQNFFGLFQHYERLKIMERFKRGKKFKVMSGKLMGYTPPYGYSLVRKTTTNDSHFIINETEAEVVKLIFNLIAEKGFTIKHLASYLFEKGIKPSKSKSGKWSRGRLSTLLSNCTYYGEANYYKSKAVEPEHPVVDTKYKKIKKSSRRARPLEDQVTIRVPAIISKETFDKAQNIIKGNTVFSKRNTKQYNYLLSKLVRCSCGRARSGEGDYSRGHYYYRCTDRLHETATRKCFERAVRAEVLEDLVWNKVTELITSPKLIKEQATRWTSTQEQYSPISQFNLQNLETKLAKLKQEEKRYLKAYGEGILDESLFKDQMQAVRTEIRSLEATINETKLLTHPEKKALNIPDLEGLCGKMKIWLSQASTQDKQTILRLVVQSVVASQNEAVVSGCIPLEIPEVTKNIEYESIHRYCGSPQCRKINIV